MKRPTNKTWQSAWPTGWAAPVAAAIAVPEVTEASAPADSARAAHRRSRPSALDLTPGGEW